MSSLDYFTDKRATENMRKLISLWKSARRSQLFSLIRKQLYTATTAAAAQVNVFQLTSNLLSDNPFNDLRSKGAGVPGSIRAESRMVIETVSKSTTTSSTMTQQQQQQTIIQQQQQQQQIQQQQAVPVAAPAAAPDASKVTASGNGLHQATINQETSFIIDGSETGYNMLVIGIAGPRVPCEQLSTVHMGNLKYIVKYRLSQRGNYVLMVKWGDEHIRGSPFNIVAQ